MGWESDGVVGNGDERWEERNAFGEGLLLNSEIDGFSRRAWIKIGNSFGLDWFDFGFSDSKLVFDFQILV